MDGLPAKNAHQPWVKPKLAEGEHEKEIKLHLPNILITEALAVATAFKAKREFTKDAVYENIHTCAKGIQQGAFPIVVESRWIVQTSEGPVYIVAHVPSSAWLRAYNLIYPDTATRAIGDARRDRQARAAVARMKGDNRFANFIQG